MKFKIDFQIPKRTFPTRWPSFYMMGSCFAENQSKRMRNLGMNSYSNPFGIIYNPFSIEKILSRLANDQDYKESDFQNMRRFFSWEHHGDYKYDNVDEALEWSNQTLKDSNKSLCQSDIVILTLGTALVYKHQDTIVANCHKVPNKEFEHKATSYDEVFKSLQASILHIQKLNPEAHIILTVSPIRHLRSGVIANSRSKATLLSAVHELVSNSKNTSYFPSYEIFVDELRDYRFAKEDMAHPTPQAENYIWERFCQVYFSEETQKILQEVQKYKDFTNHIPTNKLKHEEQVA
ncbi:MAG: GSCFA domain-containing protein, partial [Bacteroidia bacterium]